jgi:TrmH family RNA methyltransferase
MRLLTKARDLRRRKARERDHLFVAEGVRAVGALMASPIVPVGILVSEPDAGDTRIVPVITAARALGVPVEVVSARDFASATETESPQGVLAIAPTPRAALPDDPASNARVVILDAVQDPGNVGTIVRAAAAFGLAATITTPGTVDVWNGKVVRSAMGALFVHPAIPCAWDVLAAWLTRHTFACWIADAEGAPLSQQLDLLTGPGRVALIVGNEGAGSSAEARAVAAHTVRVEMTSDVESLNVAVATSILLHAIRSTRAQ